ncbi:MAG: hypothetical protein QXW35_05180 [Candidatus Aenigmatarchaeota archaeon]
MKKKIIFHLGYFKTGSSSLQRFLANNFSQKTEFNIYYPKTFRINDAHHLLPISILKTVCPEISTEWGIDKNLVKDYTQNLENYLNMLIKEIEDNPYGLYVISSEFFCDFLHSEIRIRKSESKLLELLNDIIQKYFSSYSLYGLIYLRRHDQYIFSMYEEILKGLQFMTITDFIKHESYSLSTHIYFSGVLNFFKSVFSDNLFLYIYNKKENVINSFFQFLHRELKINNLGIEGFLKDINLMNKSFGLESINLLLFYNYLNSRLNDLLEGRDITIIKDFLDIISSTYSKENINNTLSIATDVISMDLDNLRKNFNVDFGIDKFEIVNNIRTSLYLLAEKFFPSFEDLFKMFFPMKLNLVLKKFRYNFLGNE